MKKILVFFVIFSISVFSQIPAEKLSGELSLKLDKVSVDEDIFVWIFFSDKGENVSLLSSPGLVVSSKSLERRSKVLTENNLINDQDLPVSENYISQVTGAGFRLKQKSKWFNGVSGFIKKENIPVLSAFSFVKKLDVVAQLKKDYPQINNSPDLSLQSSPQQPEEIYDLNYGASLTQLQQINVPAIHNQGWYGQGVTICVMDAGFNKLSHEVFSTMNIIAKWDFVNNDPGVGDSTDMGTGTHGTQTLSVIGGYKEGQLIGPAFVADFILAKTENTDSETPIEEDNWIAALEWADSIGVDVTSTSLGYIGFDYPFPSYTWQSMNGNTARITIAADLAVARGIVVVNSAGNEGSNISHNTLGAPADGDSVIAVGAVTSTGTRSSFSSVGPTIDGRIKPDVMAMGSAVRVASPYGSNTSYTTADGTSFSCPLVAGAAAVILSSNRMLTPIQVRNALRMTASRSNNPDNQYGWGIINTLNAANYYPTPVELESFTYTKNSSGIVLSWITATEKNNRGFEIERKDYASPKWEKIGYINGSGTTTARTNYSFTDAAPLSVSSYYRLKQIDYDGTITYSKQINIDGITAGGYELHQNYPNPFNPVTVIKYSVPVESKVVIEIFNAIGQKVSQILNQTITPGNYEVSFNASTLPAGVYFYSIDAVALNGKQSFKSTKKLIVLK
jgi:serine protease AprX